MSIRNWINDRLSIWEHNRNARNMGANLNKRHYKPKSNSIIKILSEIENKAGLSAFDIVPYLKKTNLMSSRYSLVEKGSGGSVTDRKRNDELFKELEELGFIRIIENKLFSELKGTTYPTPSEKSVLKVKLLPKGINYLIEHRKKKTDYYFKILTIVLLFMTAIISIPQACNNWQQYYLQRPTKKIIEIGKTQTNIKKTSISTAKKKDFDNNRKKTEVITVQLTGSKPHIE